MLFTGRAIRLSYCPRAKAVGIDRPSIACSPDWSSTAHSWRCGAASPPLPINLSDLRLRLLLASLQTDLRPLFRTGPPSRNTGPGDTLQILGDSRAHLLFQVESPGQSPWNFVGVTGWCAGGGECVETWRPAYLGARLCSACGPGSVLLRKEHPHSFFHIIQSLFICLHLPHCKPSSR